MNTKNLFLWAFLAVVLGLFAACGDSAKPRLITVSGKTLADKLEWLDSNAAGNTGYLLKIKGAHEELAPYHLSCSSGDITVQLKGVGKERVVSFSGDGPLFTINSGVTLILDNIALTGASGNNSALIQVNSGGGLQLNQGAKISGNAGGGVYNYGGTITMNGGEISGNTGGGARNDVIYTKIEEEYVTINGTFTMNGGKISGNTGGGVSNYGTFTLNGGEISDNAGDGVHNNGGIFTMNGGKISGNTSSSFDGGGAHNGVIYTMIDGVYMAVNGTFTMNGGEISDNASSYGGGVSNHGIFTMNGGTISGNTAFFYGGGVDNHGAFTMNGGKISGNASFFYGGGVSNRVTYTYTFEGYVSDVTFTMNDGEISGNTASSYGGGVFVDNGVVLEKTGGTIAGYIENDSGSNAVKDDSGAAQNDQGHSVYVYHDNSDYIKLKDAADGPGDVLLFYNGKLNPPTWSGKWDN